MKTTSTKSSNEMMWLNSLAPGRFDWNLKWGIFNIILGIGGWGISPKIILKWKSEGLTDDKSTLGQVMAWCRQATSHYLTQCWPRSLSPYGVPRPQWVKDTWWQDGNLSNGHQSNMPYCHPWTAYCQPWMMYKSPSPALVTWDDSWSPGSPAGKYIEIH